MRRFRPRSISSKWAIENQAVFTALNPSSYVRYTVVPGTSTPGARKAKNFRINLSIAGDNDAADYGPLMWIFYLQRELAPGKSPYWPVTPGAPGNLTECMSDKRSVICLGLTNGVTNGRPDFSPLSRLLSSGDAICLIVLNVSSSQPLSFEATFGCAVCYA
jgi:hypothetical protein